MKIFKYYIPLLLIGLPSLVFADTLVVELSGVKPGQGQVRVAVFKSAQGFPEGKHYKGKIDAGLSKTVKIEIPDLAPGKYAVVAFQDLNGNKKLDKNRLGIPTEPYGFSGSWRWGGAKFNETVVEFKTDKQKVSIKMR